MSPGCRRRSPRSSTTSAATTWTGSPYCANRSSCSTTCTCRSSPPAAGSSGSAVTVGLLMSIHPALALLVALRAPDRRQLQLATGRRARAQRSSRPHAAAGRAPLQDRDHTGAGQGGPGHRHRARTGARRRREWEQWYGPIARRPLDQRGVARGSPGRSSVRRTSARCCSSRRDCDGSVGDVLLILAAGARLSAYIGATVGEIGFLRGIWLDGSRRLVWLEDYAASFDSDSGSACARTARRRHPAGAGVVRVRRSFDGSRWTTSISRCRPAR